MNRGRDDNAEAEDQGADYNSERDVMFLHDLLPQIPGRKFVDREERDEVDDPAQEGVDQRIHEMVDAKFHGDYFPPK